MTPLDTTCRCARRHFTSLHDGHECKNNDVPFDDQEQALAAKRALCTLPSGSARILAARGPCVQSTTALVSARTFCATLFFRTVQFATQASSSVEKNAQQQRTGRDGRMDRFFASPCPSTHYRRYCATAHGIDCSCKSLFVITELGVCKHSVSKPVREIL